MPNNDPSCGTIMSMWTFGTRGTLFEAHQASTRSDSWEVAQGHEVPLHNQGNQPMKGEYGRDGADLLGI